MLQFPFLPPTSDFQLLFDQIEVLSRILAHTKTSKAHQNYVFHQQLLKSSLFSARIEGNTLTLPTIKHLEENPREKNKKEVSNTLKALGTIPKLSPHCSSHMIKDIHQIIMQGLDATAGRFRHESSAIFDQYGNVIYLTPSPEEMQIMLELVIANVNNQAKLSWREQLILIPACHYYFEKAHPFLDGNGRTGRVLMHYQLHQTKLFSEVFLPIDQYFDEHRSEYYELLGKNSRTITDLVTFFLEAVVWALLQFLSDLQTLSAETKDDDLLSLVPRRQEIVHIIADHPYISLESLARRFPTLSKRTLTYDLQKLIEANFITKSGTTRGAVYSVAGKK